MTNQEAIKELSEWLDGCCGGEEIEPTRQALRLAISALEKQIPKKPIHIDKNKEFDGNWKKACPLCGRMLMERITTSEESYPRYYNHTEHCLCGQAIDWEEE